jgi:GT2 family glycosyltransferase
MNPFSASVIVSSFNRQDIINRTIGLLSYLCAGEKAELIVVDQSGYHLNNAEIVSSRCEFKTIRLFTPNLPAARNAGAQAAKGDILLFIDDDAIPQEGWIRAHLAPFADPLVGCVGGKVLDGNAKGDSAVPVAYNSKNGEYIADFGCNFAQETISFPGGNCAIRKKVWEQIRFDPAYKANAYFEEVDFAFRARQKGWKIFYEPKAGVFHQPAKAGGCRYEKKAETYYRFRNFALFYFRFNGLRNFIAFAGKEKKYAEFISRKDSGRHRMSTVITAGAGLFSGMILGLARRMGKT